MVGLIKLMATNRDSLTFGGTGKSYITAEVGLFAMLLSVGLRNVHIQKSRSGK